MNISIVEMEKVNEKNNKNSKLNKWIYYLRNYLNESKRDIIEQIKQESEEVRMADTTNYEITKEEWDYIYETWKNKPEIDMKFALGAAERRGYEQGFREGIAQGIAEGITEQLVQRALQRGRSIEFIMDEFDVSKEYVLSIQKSQ